MEGIFHRAIPVRVAATVPATGALGTTAGATTVTFDGRPAPMLYASASAVAVIVPYEVSGTSTSVSVSFVNAFNNQTPAAVPVQLAASAPGVFTSDASGSGVAVRDQPGWDGQHGGECCGTRVCGAAVRHRRRSDCAFRRRWDHYRCGPHCSRSNSSRFVEAIGALPARVLSPPSRRWVRIAGSDTDRKRYHCPDRGGGAFRREQRQRRGGGDHWVGTASSQAGVTLNVK